MGAKFSVLCSAFYIYHLTEPYSEVMEKEFFIISVLQLRKMRLRLFEQLLKIIQLVSDRDET